MSAFLKISKKVRISCDRIWDFVLEVSNNDYDGYPERIDFLISELIQKCPKNVEKWKTVKGFRS